MSPEPRQRLVNPNEILKLDPKQIWIKHGDEFLDHAHGKTEGDGATIRDIILFPRMEKLLGDINEKTVILDAGCGNSVFCDRLRDRTTSIFEFDIVASLLSSKSVGKKKAFIADMTQNFPLPEESFDIVISNLNLMWLPKIEIYATEVSRVLKPGGKLVLSITHPFVNLGEWDDSDPNNLSLVNKHPLNSGVYWKMINMTNGPYLYYQRSPSEYINTFTNKGFNLAPGTGCEEVFFTDEEIKILGSDYQKHQNYPLFLLLSFVK